MSKIKKISHILLALVLASTAAVIVWYYVKINTPSVKVVVASDKVAIGTVLGSQHVALKDYPRAVVPNDAETSLQGVLGKTIVSGTVFPGEVIRRGHIATDTGSLKAVLISMAPGREAIDLPAETSTGLKGIAVGDRINVFTEVTMAKDTSVVDCVSSGAVVLKIPPLTTGSSSLTSAGPSKGAFVIAVTPEEAKKVAEGIVRGKKFSVTLLPKGGQ